MASEPTGAIPEPRSPYSSALRDQQARATRRSIVVAAGELFVEQGYAATTIDAVAKRAGVGRKTVFDSVGGKGALLKLAWDWALVGDDEPLAMVERPAVRAMLAEHDPARLVRMWVDMVLDVGLRAAQLGGVVFAAADVDAEARSLTELIRQESLAGAVAFVSHLAGQGGLREDVSVERAAETCWALLNSLLLNRLVSERGWSVDEYGAWLVQVLSATLLRPEHFAEAPATSAVLVTDQPDRFRYLATVDGRPAGHLSYRSADHLLVLIQTEVTREHDTDGTAGALVRQALEDARAEGALVLPVCPYATWWIDSHPDAASLLYRPQPAE